MLTGRFTFRRTLTGKIVLQVEEDVRTLWPMSHKRAFRRRWRDAKLMDLTATQLRPLMDLRLKPPDHTVVVSSAPATGAPTDTAPNVVPLPSR